MSGKLQCKCLLKLGYATWSKAPVKWLQNAAVQGHIRSKLLLIDVTRGPVQDVISNLAEAEGNLLILVFVLMRCKRCNGYKSRPAEGTQMQPSTWVFVTMLAAEFL
jgi:hypothetical protein